MIFLALYHSIKVSILPIKAVQSILFHIVLVAVGIIILVEVVLLKMMSL